MDHGFPEDRVLATTCGEQAWAIADLDVDALERNREQAQVAVDRDWDGQTVAGVAKGSVFGAKGRLTGVVLADVADSPSGSGPTSFVVDVTATSGRINLRRSV